MTPIDIAHADMKADESNDTARLRFYERLIDCELFMLLEAESDGINIKPDLFEVEEQQVALVFDKEDRLADFANKIVPFAALSGRSIVSMITEKNISLGLNLAVAPSSIILPPNVISWMAETISNGPTVSKAKIKEVFSPRTLPEVVISALDSKLATMIGYADIAYLAEVKYDNDMQSSVIIFINAKAEAEEAIANAISETLIFSGIEAGILDVIFLDAKNPVCAKLAKHGLRFDLPKPEEKNHLTAPGLNPNKPPILI
tara:strand:+ start:575 stop:1351 length:777 start_codon:yes stop_codon:yes gene_type:complete